jgi:hypothetical protein
MHFLNTLQANNLIETMSRTAKKILSCVPPKFGFCANMSATWAKILHEVYSIHANVVLGDLALENKSIFTCKKNLSTEQYQNWVGHCWIEVNNYIGDISLFRTAYRGSDEGKQLLLKKYVYKNFGTNKGFLIAHMSKIPKDMKYTKKFLANEEIIEGLHRATCSIMEIR